MDNDIKQDMGNEHMVRMCPECFRTYPDEVRFCGIDGAPLAQRAVSSTSTPEHGPSYEGQLIDGRYRVKQLIGRGGMGSVFEVEHVHMQKRLAMKMLHEEMVARKQLISRFTREARAVSRLSNEHTVRVYDFGRHKNIFFLVMEFLDGEDLEIVLSREGALPWRRTLRILDQVCESLDEAHSAGIIHRDLKPENIMILDQGPKTDRVKVLDFGLAKITDNAKDVFTVHSARDLFGTPFYMSPEQIRSEDIDPRADVYALGCLLYRTLTNRHVFDAPYAFDVLRQHLTAEVPAASEMVPHAHVPDRVNRIIWRAMAKHRDNRFPDVATLRREIQECMGAPDAESALVPSNLRPNTELVPAIDAELEARLAAFEESHKAAEARMYGEEPPSAPPLPPAWDIPVGIAVNTGEFDMSQAVFPDQSTPNLAPGTPTMDWKDSRAGVVPYDTEPELESPPPVAQVIHPRAIRAPGEIAGRSGEEAATIVDNVPIVSLDTERDVRIPTHLFKLQRPRLKRPDLDTDIDTIALSAQEGLWLEKQEEEAYARKLRRGRQWQWMVASMLFVAGGVMAMLFWFNQSPSLPAHAEAEPNNHPVNANPITSGIALTGALGDRLSVFESDRDLYRLDMGGPGRFLELEVSGVPSMDLYVDVLDAGGRPITRVDYDGIGASETLHRLRVPGDEVVLVVSEAKKGDATPTEASTENYTITANVVETLPPGEVEPNDTAPAANAYRPATRISGYLDGIKDIDYYAVGVDDLRGLGRWEITVEAAGSMVPRVSLFRVTGEDKLLVFADEGSSATLKTIYEEPTFPNARYLVAVEHAGRGDRRGSYHLNIEALPAKPAIAHEPNDDRARATRVAIGQEIRGGIETTADGDVFAIPVTDPQHRTIEILMDPVLRSRLHLSLSDLHKANSAEFPKRRNARKNSPPQPLLDQGPIRFTGNGDTYYLTVKGRGRRVRDVAYSMRVTLVMQDDQLRAVGGPGR